MKKLVSLILILGMVPLASAGLTLTVANNVATIHSDSVDAWAALVTVTVGLGEVTALTQQGNLSLSKNENFGVVSGEDLGFPELGMVTVYDISVAGSVGEVIIPGAQYTVTLPQGMKLGNTDMGMGRIDVLAYDLSGIIATAYVIPEPASMLLLGLGGLFLRRK